MKNYKNVLSMILLAGAVAVTGCGGSGSTPATDTGKPAEVKVTNGSVKVGDIKVDGTGVSMPGVNVKTSADGTTKVNVGGLNVDVKTEGGATNVSMPGIDVKTTEDGKADVNVGGIKINADGEDANVDVGGIKIESKGGTSSIKLPGGITINTGD